MVAAGLAAACRISPPLRRTLWWMWYQGLAMRFRTIDWPFMNYGFAVADSDAPRLQLRPADEPHRLYIQLYDHVRKPLGLADRDVLDVGCGRGGGCAFIARYLRPRSIVGLDYSSKAVALCRRLHVLPGLTFVQGDADALPFPDARFDVVVSVESSHCFQSVPQFLAEVRRVLRPGGHFVLADFRERRALDRFREELQGSGMAVLAEEAITLNVLAALDADRPRKLAIIRSEVPRLLRRVIARFSGTDGSAFYQAMRDGRVEYFRWVLRRAAPRGLRAQPTDPIA